MKLTRTKYDQAYFENPLHKQFLYSQRNRNRFREIRKIKKKGKFLELGFGKGYLLNLASNYFDVYGVDISEYAVESLKDKFGGERIRQGDISEIKIGEGEYDVVAAFNLFEHIKEPRAVLENVYRSLKTGGLLIGSVPNNTPVVGGLFTLLVNKLLDKTHVSTFKPEKWYGLFCECGFDNLHFFGEFVLTKNRSFYIIHSPLWKLLSHNLVFSARKND